MTDVRDDQADAADARNDDLAVAAAVFLAQVLELEDDPAVLTDDLSVIKRDQNASIYTIQLESSVGPAAFLVYTYLLDVTGGDGHTGKEHFDAGLATLQQAATRNTPGPRAVAHAETDLHGFILATTPGTYRALAGETSMTTLEPSPEDMPATGETDKVRSEAAEDLLQLLQDANAQARTWMTAIQSASYRDQDDDSGDMIEFTEAETELALFLLDDSSIGDLLRALNMLVATAQQRTADALNYEGEPESSWPEADA
jgi:hypothetical protein